MMTWQIMIGAQLISILVSGGVVVSFMLKKEPLDAVKEKKAASIKKVEVTTATI